MPGYKLDLDERTLELPSCGNNAGPFMVPFDIKRLHTGRHVHFINMDTDEDGSIGADGQGTMVSTPTAIEPPAVIGVTMNTSDDESTPGSESLLPEPARRDSRTLTDSQLERSLGNSVPHSSSSNEEDENEDEMEVKSSDAPQGEATAPANHNRKDQGGAPTPPTACHSETALSFKPYISDQGGAPIGCMLDTANGDTPCLECHSAHDTATMLLCKECDAVYHPQCLPPTLSNLPQEVCKYCGACGTTSSKDSVVK